MGPRRRSQALAAQALAAFALVTLAPIASATVAAPTAAATRDTQIAQRVMKLTRATHWTLVEKIEIPFRTFHPQGMVKIGEDFYVSSVEIRTQPKRLSPPVDGHDRDTGAGVGHLFKIGPDGKLIADLVLGQGSAYHPGGIDFDGVSIWVPTSEYRPDSRAIVYRVDLVTMTATEMFRFGDHIGALAYDRLNQTLHGVSWGARRFYAWPLRRDGKLAAAAARPEALATPNPQQYLDYQDCHGVGRHEMLCSGVGDYVSAPGSRPFQLGGIDLVDLKANRPVWTAPIELRSPTGRVMTQNPFFVEAVQGGLRAYFMPDDDASTLFVFEAVVP